MSDASALYHAKILALDESPMNEGRLDDATHQAKCSNPLCGDRVEVSLRVEDEIIREVRFVGRGCALSRASAAMLTEDAVGLSVEAATVRGAAIEAWLKNGAPMPASVAGLEALEGVRSFPSRVGCVTLAWVALEKALS